MSNLFSVFDPNALMGMPVNWLAAGTCLGLLSPSFWATSSPSSASMKAIINVLKNEFLSALPAKSVPGTSLIAVAFFVFVFLNNFTGLFPYVFTSTSHLSLTLAVALPIWLGYMMFNMLVSPNSVAGHLVPLGSPLPLSPILVMVELVSNLIRPMTLAIRLAANMVAGHLLLSLLSGPAVCSSAPLLVIILTCLVALSVLESAVATIQAYVFSILSTLYIAEVDPVL